MKNVFRRSGRLRGLAGSGERQEAIVRQKIYPDIIGQQQILELPCSASVREAAKRMSQRHVGSVLVTREGALVGIFTERDLLTRVVAMGRSPDNTLLFDVMTKNPDTVAPDGAPIDALRRMTQRGFRHLPVVDNGRLIGVLSRRDFQAREIAHVEEEIGHEMKF
jgi:signal-transduction protein with cAMP-binding, CBS, and nucleotidyltransferase domain